MSNLETSREKKILADLFPNEYKARLESQIFILQEQIKTLENSNSLLKKKTIRLMNEIDTKDFANDRLIKMVESFQKKKTIVEVDHRASLSKILATPSNNQGVQESKEFGNMSSIIYNFDDLKNQQTNDYDFLHENIIENIEEEEDPKTPGSNCSSKSNSYSNEIPILKL